MYIVEFNWKKSKINLPALQINQTNFTFGGFFGFEGEFNFFG